MNLQTGADHENTVELLVTPLSTIGVCVGLTGRYYGPDQHGNMELLLGCMSLRLAPQCLFLEKLYNWSCLS